MRAHVNERRLGKRFLLAAGLIIALVVVPSAAFGGGASFSPECDPGCDPPIGSMEVKRVNGKNKRVEAVDFYQFRVNCPTGWPTTVMTYLDKPITGDVVQNAIAIDAKVQHRKWHFNELVRDAVGHTSNERIDATINFRGQFRKHNKDKADGTLEVTLEGGATYLDLDVSGTEPIVTEQPIAGSQWQEEWWDSGPEDCHGVQDFHLKRLRPQDR
jgi:hypothetical protein